MRTFFFHHQQSVPLRKFLIPCISRNDPDKRNIYVINIHINLWTLYRKKSQFIIHTINGMKNVILIMMRKYN